MLIETNHEQLDYPDALKKLHSSLPYIELSQDRDDELCAQKLTEIVAQIEGMPVPYLNSEQSWLAHYLVMRELLSLGDTGTRSRLRALMCRGQSSCDPQVSSVSGRFECVENGVGKKVEKNIAQGENRLAIIGRNWCREKFLHCFVQIPSELWPKIRCRAATKC